MTNKRQLKKYIKAVCGQAATDLLIFRWVAEGFKDEDIDKIIVNIAALQQSTLRHVSVAFEHKASDFDNPSMYRKSLKDYRKATVKKLMSDFEAGLSDIAKQMNDATPESVRKAIKEALN